MFQFSIFIPLDRTRSIDHPGIFCSHSDESMQPGLARYLDTTIVRAPAPFLILPRVKKNGLRYTAKCKRTTKPGTSWTDRRRYLQGLESPIRIPCISTYTRSPNLGRPTDCHKRCCSPNTAVNPAEGIHNVAHRASPDLSAGNLECRWTSSTGIALLSLRLALYHTHNPPS